MKNRTFIIAVALCAGIFFATSFANAGKLLEEAKENFAPLPKAPVEKASNKLNEEKVELGKMLYFEHRLSKSSLISCNTCHNLAGSATDNLETSVGHKWQKGPRNAPTVWNAALHLAQFWDGRAEDVEAQAQGPVLAGVEMAATQDLVLQRLKSIPEYVDRFTKAFPGDNSLTYTHMADAIGAFERTLLTPSPFDAFLGGDKKALSDDEKKGLKLFMDKGCVGCHNGVAVGGNSYMTFGVENPYKNQKDVGRFNVTKDEADKYSFKVPSLRNIELTYPYFHDGKVWELEEAIGIMGWTQLGVKLSDKEIGSIAKFLGSLTGTIQVELPNLPPSTASTPKPLLDVK